MYENTTVFKTVFNGFQKPCVKIQRFSKLWPKSTRGVRACVWVGGCDLAWLSICPPHHARHRPPHAGHVYSVCIHVHSSFFGRKKARTRYLSSRHAANGCVPCLSCSSGSGSASCGATSPSKVRVICWTMAPHLTPDELDTITVCSAKQMSALDICAVISKRRASARVAPPKEWAIRRAMAGATHKRGAVEARGAKRKLTEVQAQRLFDKRADMVKKADGARYVPLQEIVTRSRAPRVHRA